MTNYYYNSKSGFPVDLKVSVCNISLWVNHQPLMSNTYLGSWINVFTVVVEHAVDDIPLLKLALWRWLLLLLLIVRHFLRFSPPPIFLCKTLIIRMMQLILISIPKSQQLPDPLHDAQRSQSGLAVLVPAVLDGFPEKLHCRVGVLPHGGEEGTGLVAGD